MGLLDGLLGGFIGGQAASIVNKLIEEHGGLSGIVSQLQKGGLADVVKSWISTGPNQPVTGQQLHQALGPEMIEKLASQFGIPAQDLMSKLAEILPKAVDKLTPDGKLPT